MHEVVFRNFDDTLWKDAGCSSELDNIEQTSWVLFLKYLDDYETKKELQQMVEAKKNERVNTIKEVKRLCKEFGFTAGMLKGSFTERRRKTGEN